MGQKCTEFYEQTLSPITRAPPIECDTNVIEYGKQSKFILKFFLQKLQHSLLDFDRGFNYTICHSLLPAVIALNAIASVNYTVVN